VDRAAPEIIKKAHADVQIAVASWKIDSAETLETFTGDSQDFVIANHVFEHLENPILSIKNWVRVLKPGGVIFAAIPDSRYTFDAPREQTDFQHLVSDFLNGPDTSLDAHYRDWFTNADVPLKGYEVEARVSLAMRERANIHFHVWNRDGIEKMFTAFKLFYVDIEKPEFFQNGHEVIVICKKASE
jgi:ubiquinone/menaquinone biosynthesis C-methylase UbiE